MVDYPRDWKQTSIGNLLSRGVLSKVQDGNHGNDHPRADDFVTQGIPFIVATNISNGQIDLENCKFLNKSQADSLRIGFSFEGDVLLTHKGTVGNTAIVPKLNGMSYIMLSPQVTAYRIGQENSLSREYLYQFFQGPQFQHRLASISAQTTRAYIGITEQKKQIVVLPPLAEQRAIARILGTWDEAIALTESLIEALQQRKKGLMQKLLTGEVRFPGFDDEWQELRLGKLFKERKERGFDNLPLVSITNSDGIVFRDELDRRDTSSADKSKYLRIVPGDIGYNTMRMWQGVSGVSSIEGIVSPAYTIVMPKDGTDADFMGYLFQLPAMIYLFWRYSQGLVDDTLNLKYPSFSIIRVTVPKKNEQEAIAGILKACDKEITALHTYKAELQQQKKGLMQQLLTGQVRVKVGE